MFDCKVIELKVNVLDVNNVGGIFVVFFGGLVIVVLVVVLEFIWKFRKNVQEDRVRFNNFGLI